MIEALSRRSFLKGSSAAVMGLGSGFAAFSNAAPFNNQILVYVFLRGGIDGANVIIPLAGDDRAYYEAMRNNLIVPVNNSLQIGAENFYFNPAAQPLLNLYNAGYLALVQAVGTPDDIASRSHFDAEKYIELGTPTQVSGTSGWLHRHFDAMANQLNLLPPEILIPILAFRSTPPTSLLGNTSTLTVYSPGSFELDNAHWRWDIEDPDQSYDDNDYMQLDLLPDLYDPTGDFIEQSGAQALVAEAIMRESYDPAYTGSGSLVYPGGNYFAERIKDIAQLIKLDPDIGLRIATVDFGGWDTHVDQESGNYYSNNLGTLCQAIEAFFDDLESSGGDYAERTTMIVQSEFGRRWFENADSGTDHGNGNFMLVCGKQVNGGQLYGAWPGVYPGLNQFGIGYPNPKDNSETPELFNGALATTTDFRQILGEYLMKRGQHNATTLNYVLPDDPNYSWQYNPLGIFNPITINNEILMSGFEG